MKRFLLKVMILGAIIFTLLLTVNAAYVNTEYYKNLNGMRKFSEVPEHIDIVNFGNSHGQMSFCWDDYTEFTGMNMALASQTIVYDEALFRQYFECLREGSIVVLEISFRSLYVEEENKVPYSSKITRYYRVLEREYFEMYNFFEALKYKYIPVLGDREAAVRVIAEEWFEKETEEIAPADEKLYVDISAPETIVWGAENAAIFMEMSGNQECGEQYEALVRIIEKCKANNIQVILVTAPTLSCFYEAFTEEFMDKFYADVQEISRKYGVRYVDYTGDSRFINDGYLFVDPNHMSVYGSKIFTEEFLKDNADILWFYREQE